MAIAYRFKNLAELAEYVREQGAKRREAAPGLRSKRKQDDAITEAAVFEHVGDLIASTVLEDK